MVHYYGAKEKEVVGSITVKECRDRNRQQTRELRDDKDYYSCDAGWFDGLLDGLLDVRGMVLDFCRTVRLASCDHRHTICIRISMGRVAVGQRIGNELRTELQSEYRKRTQAREGR
eukprot:scaffold14_cov130-Cylindrotheca_fusiformis.AAC.9